MSQVEKEKWRRNQIVKNWQKEKECRIELKSIEKIKIKNNMEKRGNRIEI